MPLFSSSSPSPSSLPPTDPRRPLLPNGRPTSLLNRSLTPSSNNGTLTSPPSSSDEAASPSLSDSFLSRRRHRRSHQHNALYPSHPNGVSPCQDPEDRPALSALGLFNMTISLAGMQFTWTVELAYGTPFLLGLGLSKSLISLVWLAGPLSGLIVQPLVGAYADVSRSRFGRRRPFIFIGAILVLLSMHVIAHAKDLGNSMAHLFFSSEDLHFNLKIKHCTIAIAIAGFYVMDFAVNAVQASLRALVLDRAPAWQQARANGWAAAQIGMGSVIGYFAGFIDLVLLFPSLGSSQMEALCAVASVFFAITILWTCIFTQEIPLPPSGPRHPNSLEARPSSFLTDSIHFLRSLPPSVQRVCDAQFFAWIGWFPFLFYSTSWVMEVIFRNHEPDEPGLPDAATRAGSFALLCYSLLSLLVSFLLPPLSLALIRWIPHYGEALFGIRPLWTLSQLLFSLVMVLGVPWAKDVHDATLVITLCGITWAVAMWAPFAIIGEECAKAGIDRVGSVLGVHNIYIVLPQFVSIAFSGLIFHYLSNPPDQGHHDSAESTGVVLQWAGLMAGIGALMSLRCLRSPPLHPDLQDGDEGDVLESSTLHSREEEDAPRPLEEGWRSSGPSC